MKAEELTVEVKAKIDVDESTANACLKLVEIYLNAHNKITLNAKDRDNGEVELTFSELTGTC